MSCSAITMFVSHRMVVTVQLVFLALIVLNPVKTFPKSRGSETCPEKCLQDRIKSETECKNDFQTNRTQFMNCSAENMIEYDACLSECGQEVTPAPEEAEVTDILSCDFLCTREHMRCQGLCRRHPFKDEWDRTECTRECDFESEVCKEMCEDSA